MKMYLYLGLLVVGISPLQAQRNCGTVDYNAELVRKDSSIFYNRLAIENMANDFSKSVGNRVERFGKVTIPVVVHVVYNNASQNISDAQISSQIKILNDDFNRSNADWTNTPAQWQPLVADCNVNFCLATIDPQGQPTTGIVRKQTAVTSFLQDNKVKSGATGGDDAWDTQHYLNIWVCNLGNNLLGYAQFPGGPQATDGVVILYTAFGNTGNVKAPFHLGRTTTHEVGHWLNLNHIWGDDGNACHGTDNVDDTPNQSGANTGCLTFPRLDACTNAAPGVMFMNYMDYVDDNCMVMFSTGQRDRMQAMFSPGGARAAMLNSKGCRP